MTKQYLPDLWKHPNYTNQQLKEQFSELNRWNESKTKKYKIFVRLVIILGVGVGMYVSIAQDGYIHFKIVPIILVCFATAVGIMLSELIVDVFASKNKPNLVVIEAYKDDLKLLADQLTMSPGELEEMDPDEIVSKYISPRMNNLQNFIDQKMKDYKTAPLESDRLQKLRDRSERFQLHVKKQ